MLKFFKRRRSVKMSLVDADDPLAIRDLLDHPELRALLATGDDEADAAPSPSWVRLAAAGPIRFEPTTSSDIAA
jgi:hypothetical protein